MADSAASPLRICIIASSIQLVYSNRTCRIFRKRGTSPNALVHPKSIRLEARAAVVAEFEQSLALGRPRVCPVGRILGHQGSVRAIDVSEMQTAGDRETHPVKPKTLRPRTCVSFPFR